MSDVPRIEHTELTFINLPMLQPELWAWGNRDGYTVGAVQLHCTGGIVGIGEVVVCMGPDDKVVQAIFDQVAQQFVGESVFGVERAAARVAGLGWYPFHRTLSLVIGGLEMACWDAAGKHVGLPVSELFGGALRTRFPSMYFVQGAPIEEMVERAVEKAAEGFRTIYYKVGVDEERDVELVRRTHERLGRSAKIRIDPNEAWSAGTAVRILRRMAPATIEYVEQPTPMHDIDALAHVRAASGVPVGANQASWGAHPILEIVKRGAADVIMSDTHQDGGLLPMKKVLALCETAGLPYVNHSFNVTALNITGHLHVMSTSPICYLPVGGHPDYLADDYVEPIDYSGGFIDLPRGPGLGLEIDHDKLARFHQAFLDEGMHYAYTVNHDGRTMSVPSQ